MDLEELLFARSVSYIKIFSPG